VLADAEVLCTYVHHMVKSMPNKTALTCLACAVATCFSRAQGWLLQQLFGVYAHKAHINISTSDPSVVK